MDGMRDSLLVLMLILRQSTCSVQPGITVLGVNEHTCVNLPCDCGTRGSPWVRWMRDADVDGVVEKQISCNRTDCHVIDCDQKQNTKLNHHKILPNGDLQISRVEKRDSGLYRCLNEPSRGSLTACDSTSSFCTSGDHEEESAGDVTQSSCETALLLYISHESGDSPQESKDYKIHIKTGDVWRAGTDSNVYITMCGRLKCLRSYHLEHSSTHDDPFEGGQVDVFTVQSRYLGNLENVTIWHDGSEVEHPFWFHPSWFLKNIRIIETFSGMEQTFTCLCSIEGNKPETLFPQIPRSCDSSDKKEPKKPQVPNPLMETPLLSCEIQNPPSNKFSLLWMFRSTEGHNRVIAVAGTWTDILASCLGKSKERNHGVLGPGQDSCPESSHCLLPPSGVTRDELERYWCLIGPGEDGTWREQVLSVLSFTPDYTTDALTTRTTDALTTRTPNESTTSEETNNPSSLSGCRPALAAAITLNVLALFPFTMFVFLVKRYREEDL